MGELRLVRIFVAPFGVQRFLFSRVFTDEGVWRRMVSAQFIPGDRLALRAFFNGDNTRFPWIWGSGRHSVSFFYLKSFKV
ncbi:hypothetical protein A6A30_02380 [Klebsiella michiganensis]|nr:hypothetical protein A6A30_02380 [Klebsiella michiganensis]